VGAHYSSCSSNMADASVESKELGADIDELKRLLAECQRPRVKQLLERELEEIEKVSYCARQVWRRQPLPILILG
jgi:hypothetical protein